MLNRGMVLNNFLPAFFNFSAASCLAVPKKSAEEAFVATCNPHVHFGYMSLENESTCEIIFEHQFKVCFSPARCTRAYKCRLSLASQQRLDNIHGNFVQVFLCSPPPLFEASGSEHTTKCPQRP